MTNRAHSTRRDRSRTELAKAATLERQQARMRKAFWDLKAEQWEQGQAWLAEHDRSAVASWLQTFDNARRQLLAR